MKLVSIVPAPSGSPKKYVATFETNGRTKKVSFGARGYSDYTMHHDDTRRSRYLMRHRSRERWSDPTSPGALSRYVLWNKRSVRASIADYKRRFNL